MQILLVEDNEDFADSLVKLLSGRQGISVCEVAYNLSDGLAKSAALKPDITLLDLCLPDSPDPVETLKSIPFFRPPVIVITDYDNEDVKVEAFKAGADDVLSKKTVVALTSILISAATAANMRRLAQESSNG